MEQDTTFSEPHEVTGHLDGDWIIYECHLCNSKLKFNTKTQKIVSNREEKESEIRHIRVHSILPPEVFSINFSVSVGQKKDTQRPTVKFPFNLNFN